MPLYEYRCHKCGQVFEKIQKFSDEPDTSHENCGGAVERLISAPGLHFKGSGWYVTDYARSGAEKKPAANASGDGKSASGDSKTGGDSKTSSGDSKSGDSKSGDSKPSETKTETKTASKPSETSK